MTDTLPTAAYGVNFEAVKWLLSKGALDVDATALAGAAAHNRVDICNILLPTTNTASPKQLGDALTLAARASSLQSVSFLLDAGIDVNQKDSFREAAIQAALNPHIQPNAALIKLLVERGAEIEAQDRTTQERLTRFM